MVKGGEFLNQILSIVSEIGQSGLRYWEDKGFYFSVVLKPEGWLLEVINQVSFSLDTPIGDLANFFAVEALPSLAIELLKKL